MDKSKGRVRQFLKKEIQTYRALALFFTKNRIEKRERMNGKEPLTSPAFYTERMKEARRLVNELRKAG